MLSGCCFRVSIERAHVRRSGVFGTSQVLSGHWLCGDRARARAHTQSFWHFFLSAVRCSVHWLCRNRARAHAHTHAFWHLFWFTVCIWAVLGHSWASPGLLLGLSWALLGLRWALLGLSWALLGSSGPLLGSPGLSWAILGSPGPILGSPGLFRGSRS